MEDHSPSRVLVMQLSDALLPILATSAGSGRRRTRGDDAATLRVLGVLAAIWAKAAESSTQGMHRQLESAGGMSMKGAPTSVFTRGSQAYLISAA